MLISITEKCHMNCPHCMDDAKCNSDKFMTFDTFKKAIKFNIENDISITITGGEPTEHPQFWEFLEYASKEITSNHIITVVTNGMNLDKDVGELMNKIIELDTKSKGTITFQVTSVPNLYPIQINLCNPIFHIKQMVIATEIEAMYPQGRAKGKDYDFSKCKGPKCFNARSLIKNNNMPFKQMVYTLRFQMFKFCTPQIGYDGSIKVGESTLCPPVSHIDKSLSEIENDIKNFRCQGCKELLDKLPDLHKSVIGEL
ncbi:MAG: radical SAM protein [Acholeplasmatales bacterium]|nr:radical SAM protein [Acholeplasmatales bacterium]